GNDSARIFLSTGNDPARTGDPWANAPRFGRRLSRSRSGFGERSSPSERSGRRPVHVENRAHIRGTIQPERPREVTARTQAVTVGGHLVPERSPCPDSSGPIGCKVPVRGTIPPVQRLGQAAPPQAAVVGG